MHIVKVLAAACIFSSASVLAALTASPGNIRQPSCGIGTDVSVQRFGTVAFGSGATSIVKSKKTNVNTKLKAGDVIFYVSMNDANKSYQTEKQIEIIDSSPLNPDIALTPDMQFRVVGTVVTRSGRSYDIIGVRSFFMLVDDTGFICSTTLDRNFTGRGMPVVHQELPLKEIITEVSYPTARTTSAAVTFVSADGATFSIDTTLMINGKVSKKQSSSFDLISGEATIGALILNAAKDPEGSVLVRSIKEPSNLHLWAASIK
jgi:hypothetical protein